MMDYLDDYVTGMTCEEYYSDDYYEGDFYEEDYFRGGHPEWIDWPSLADWYYADYALDPEEVEYDGD